MKFTAEKNALTARRGGETLRIEGWGKDSLRVRAVMYDGWTGNDWALTEAPEQNVPPNQNLTPVQQQVQQALEQQNGNRTVVLVLCAILVFALALAAVLRSVMRRRREADLD